MRYGPAGGRAENADFFVTQLLSRKKNATQVQRAKPRGNASREVVNDSIDCHMYRLVDLTLTIT